MSTEENAVEKDSEDVSYAHALNAALDAGAVSQLAYSGMAWDFDEQSREKLEDITGRAEAIQMSAAINALLAIADSEELVKLRELKDRVDTAVHGKSGAWRDLAGMHSELSAARNAINAKNALEGKTADALREEKMQQLWTQIEEIYDEQEKRMIEMHRMGWISDDVFNQWKKAHDDLEAAKTNEEKAKAAKDMQEADELVAKELNEKGNDQKPVAQQWAGGREKGDEAIGSFTELFVVEGKKEEKNIKNTIKSGLFLPADEIAPASANEITVAEASAEDLGTKPRPQVPEKYTDPARGQESGIA